MTERKSDEQTIAEWVERSSTEASARRAIADMHAAGYRLPKSVERAIVEGVRVKELGQKMARTRAALEPKA